VDDWGKELSVRLGARRHGRRCFHLVHELLRKAALFVLVLKRTLSPESSTNECFVLRERHAIGIAIQQLVLLRWCNVVCWNLWGTDALLE